MVKVKSIEGVLITADTYVELLKAVKNESENYEGFTPKAKFLTESQAIIYHDEIIDELSEPWEGRKCCECAEHEWNIGCAHRAGRVTLMMDACEHFKIEIRED